MQEGVTPERFSDMDDKSPEILNYYYPLQHHKFDWNLKDGRCRLISGIGGRDFYPFFQDLKDCVNHVDVCI